MDELQQKEKNTNIEICDFSPQNINIIYKGNTQLLCEYKVKYTHKEDNKEDEMKEINIKIKIPTSENCSKLDDFEIFVGDDDRKLAWTAQSSQDNEKEILQYLTKLKKELNTFDDKKGDKNFRDALCIMIFYYAVKETRYCGNNEWVKHMKEDDFKQYKEIIENTIKLREKENNNKFGQRLNSADNDEHQKQGSFDNRKPASKKAGSDGCLCGIWKKFCGCCIKENRNLNTKIDKSNIGNEQINISEA